MIFSGGIVETERLAGGVVLVWELEIEVLSVLYSPLMASGFLVLSFLEAWGEGAQAVWLLLNCPMIV